MKNELIDFTKIVLEALVLILTIIIDATFIWAIFKYAFEYPIKWEVLYGVLLILSTVKIRIQE